MSNETMAEMPKYKCHKTVHALKIKDVILHAPENTDPTSVEFSGGFIIPEEKAYSPIPFDAEFWNKHKPKVGGYLVVYDDGYRSFSPAEAFENGYTRI